MVYFLNSKVKNHTGEVLQSLFNENQEKIVILGYSMVSRRSPHYSLKKTVTQSFQALALGDWAVTKQGYNWRICYYLLIIIVLVFLRAPNSAKIPTLVNVIALTRSKGL